MQWVDILENDLAGMTAKIVARARLTDEGSVALEGDEALCEKLREGVVSPERGTMVTPADGTDFLDALQLAFRTPYLFASPPQTGDAPAAPIGTVAPIALKKE